VKKRVLVIGGSVKSCGSAVRALSDTQARTIDLVIGYGTREMDEYIRRLCRPLKGVSFETIDIE
jgi:hypothetical protein